MSAFKEDSLAPPPYENDPSASSDENDLADQLSPRELACMGGKVLEFDYGTFPWRDISIEDPQSKNPIYFADISRLSRDSPDVALHSQTANGPILAESRFRLSRSIKCGVGSSPVAMDFIEVMRAGAFSKTYQFRYHGRVYSVLKARGGESGVSGSNPLGTNYKIIEEDSNQVVAYYTSQSFPGRRKGLLTFREIVSQNFEILVVLVTVSVREKGKRRARQGAAAGAAGASAVG